MADKIKENKQAIIFIIISALILSVSFYGGVIKNHKTEKINEIEPSTANFEETTEETTVLTTQTTTEETSTQTTTIVEIDDTPGTIEVPVLVPAQKNAEEVTELTTSANVNENVCNLVVDCSTILNNMDKLDKAKTSLVPSDGMLYSNDKAEIKEGDTVFSLLERELVLNNIHFEYSKTTNIYIEGIGNIYEFDCGELSGWMYKVNGEFLSVACDQCEIKPGDKVEWVYSCDLGRDVGDTYIAQ